MTCCIRSGDRVSKRPLAPGKTTTTIAWTMASAEEDLRALKGIDVQEARLPMITTDGCKKEEEVAIADRKAPLFPSSRLLLGAMNCLALLFLYLLRINLSLSMVCMVKKPLSGNESHDLLISNDSYVEDNWLQSETLHHNLHQTVTFQRSASVNNSSHSILLFQVLSATTTSESSLEKVSSNWTSSSDAGRFVRAADSNASPHLGSSENITKASSNDTILNGVTEIEEKGEFAWNRQFQGTILSSYFYGYLVTQVLGGYLSGRYGAKHVLGTGMIIMVVMTMLTPTAARMNAYLLICLRILLGAAGGVFFPSVQSLWGPWAPPFERSFLVSLTFFGITFGNILALGLSSQFCSVSLDNGWPFAFYSTGAAGFVFWICWNFCVYSTPMQHPRISSQEKAYILTCIGNKGDSSKMERPPVPWLKIISSPAVWGIMTAQTANTWFTHTSITLPFYMKDVLKFDIKQNGMFLILPYIIDIIVTPFVSKLADYLRIKKILSTVAVRKLYQSTSCVVCSVLLIILSFMDYDRRYVAVAILCIIYPFQNLYRSGYAVNLQDIAPKFAGEIFGITNTAGTICGIVSPVIVGALTTNGTKQEWQTVFFISAGFFLFGGIIFVMFAKGEIQPWACPIEPQVRLITENGGASDRKEQNGNYQESKNKELSSSAQKLALDLSLSISTKGVEIENI